MEKPDACQEKKALNHLRLWTMRSVELTTRAVWTDGALYASGADLHLRGDRGSEGGPHPVGEWAKSGGATSVQQRIRVLRMIEAVSQRVQGCVLTAVRRFQLGVHATCGEGGKRGDLRGTM